MKCATAIQPDLLMSPSPSVQAVQRFLERCQRCRPDVENLRRVSTQYVQEALNRDEFLKKREEELQNIHIISKQIKDTTQNMAIKVNEQGEQLNSIENNVENALINAEKAHEEIKQADKMSAKNKKKMWCFICIITISILAISAIILSLIFGINN